jgi:hypothetical protein
MTDGNWCANVPAPLSLGLGIPRRQFCTCPWSFSVGLASSRHSGHFLDTTPSLYLLSLSCLTSNVLPFCASWIYLSDKTLRLQFWWLLGILKNTCPGHLCVSQIVVPMAYSSSVPLLGKWYSILALAPSQILELSLLLFFLGLHI